MLRILGFLAALFLALPAWAQGQIALCNVDSADPSYTAGSTRPCSVTTGGRLRIDATITPTGTQDVNLVKVGGSAITIGQAIKAASLPVVLPSDQTVVVSSVSTQPISGTVNIGNAVSIAGNVAVTGPTGSPVIVQTNGTTNVQGVANGTAINIIGTDAIGAHGTTVLSVQGAGATSTPMPVIISSTSAATPWRMLTSASTNASLIKGSAGAVYSIGAINTNATVYYLKLYDNSTTPTCNSSSVVMTWPLPVNSTSGGGFTIALPAGVTFASGIGVCVTGGINDNDNTVAAAGIAINISYK